MNILYLTTNIINGKQYIGSHLTDNPEDEYIGSGKLIKNAIKKYGKENFRREILKECETIEEARKLEESSIKKYNTLYPCGYNLHPEGGNMKDDNLPEYHKKRIGDALRGKKRDPKIGRKIRKIRIKNDSYKLSNEHKEKLRVANIGENNPNWGKSKSSETIERIRESNLGKLRSEETRKNMSKGQIGKKYQRVICEYCKSNVASNVYSRYHGEKCKNKI